MIKNKSFKLIILLCIISIVGLMFTGCISKTTDTRSDEKTEKNITGFPLMIKDSLGREVKIEKEPKRVVSLAPGNTEILFAIEAGDKVVGVTKYCDYPPEAKTKEIIGGFSDPNIEKIVSINPDLVLATTMHEKTVKELEKLNIPVIVLHAQTAEGVIKIINLAGKAVGHEKEAAAVTASMKEKIGSITEKIKDIPEKDRPSVYYEVWREPIMTAGPKTLIHDLITLAGGINIGADAETDYPQYSVETLLKKNPDVMIAPDLHGSNTATLGKVKQRPGWSNISAVKNNRVYLIEDDLITVPGPRVVDGLEAIAKALYPDRFD
ncbi:MAG: cobalamin transport system substrate-binding protein [Thermosediminibacterales bacterium]|nr:cobalamin transport system substrate-binding protein [Thermosediminibacterales bacterium]